jgi:hypothetical protein
MNGARSLGVVAIVSLAFAASCSHAPRLERDSTQVAEFRAQYLKHHPDDPFKEDILNSRVQKEMNYMQVLASWGLPYARTGIADDGTETWSYIAVEAVSREVLRYDLVFTKNRLINWLVSDDLGMGLIYPDDLTGLPTMSTGMDSPSSGLGSLEQKK